MPVETINSLGGIKYTNGDGYYFRLSQKLNGKLYLNCRVKSCQARGNLPLNFSEEDEICIRGKHNHQPDFYEQEFCEAERRILERAARDPSSLRRIFTEETANVSPKTVNRLNYPSFLRRMQRHRQNDIRKIPNTLDDFAKRMLSSEYQHLARIGGQKFFISAIKNHSILFISPTTRDLLKSVDQTFVIYQTKRVINRYLKNVLIISQIHLNVAFPIVYVGMQHRQTEAYIDVLREIKKEEPLWNPFTLYAFREESLSQAIQKVFPKCEIIPSWFHLVQELRKKITCLELSNLLFSNNEFYSCVELLLGVPLLPPEFMSSGLENVKNTIPTLITHPVVSSLFDYVSENWLPESISSHISVFEKTERLITELKLLHRQFMSSFRATARKEAIWAFTRGIVAFEKKYADAYTELLVSETPPKWTGSSSLKSQGRKVYSLMELFSEAKLTVESFLEQFVKTGINMMDLSDDGFADLSDEEDQFCQENLKEEHNSSEDETADVGDFIVEEIEECFEDDDTDPTSPIKYDPDDESIESHKRSHEFDEESAKKLRSRCDANSSEDALACPSISLNQISSVNFAFPHACVMCKVSTYAFACQPCGHLCLCNPCSKEIVRKSCPMCGKKVMQVQEIFPATPFDPGLKMEILHQEVLEF